MRPKKLLSWGDVLKPQVKRRVGQQVFNSRTRRDRHFEFALSDLSEEVTLGIVDKISEEFQNVEINLSSENIRGLAARIVGECLKTSPCRKLDLSSNFIRDCDVALLCKDLHHRGTQLEDFNLSNNRIGVDGAKALAQMLEYNKSLRTLNLDTNGITASGIEQLAQSLSKNQTLLCFSANWNNLHTYAEDFYFTLARNKSLLSLQLGYCSFGDVVAEALADGLKRNTTLRELFLFGNQITDVGAVRLVEALEVNTALTYMNLDNNLLTDSAAQQFMDLIREKASQNKELCVNILHNQCSKKVEEEMKSIRLVQIRKPTEYFGERFDSIAMTASRKGTLNEFVNNKFYEIEPFEDEYDDDDDLEDESDVGTEITMEFE